MTTVTREEIAVAYRRINGRVRRTPILRPGLGAFGLATALSLKLEFLQHAGSFKTRGAFNTMLSGPVPAVGVAAASGGNHGAAVAYAARELGHAARIFVPAIASPAKIEIIRRHGAEIVIGGERYADAQEACDRHVAETGALRIHPFSATETITGQGTVALEWDAEEPELDTVLVATGGGGLVAGMASFWAGSAKRVIAVEPEGSRALHAALEAGRPVDVPVESVAADSLGARNVGELVFGICRETIHHVTLVSDDAIVEAQRALWRECRIAVEPGGATALAALLGGIYRPAEGERVGVLVCGANIDARGLSALGA